MNDKQFLVWTEIQTIINKKIILLLIIIILIRYKLLYTINFLSNNILFIFIINFLIELYHLKCNKLTD